MAEIVTAGASARRTTVALAALVAVAAALRVWGLERQSLWIDEAYAYWFSSQSLHDLWQVFPAHHNHPPLFMTMMKGWRWLLGDGEAAMRSLSVVPSVLTVPVVFVMGRLAGGAARNAQTGLLAALVFALSPLHIDYAQQAYVYTWFTLGAGLSLAGAFWLLVHARAAERPWLDLRRDTHRAGEARATGAWAATVIGSALALWMHNVAVVYVAALGLSAAWIGWRDGRPRWYFANLVLAGLAVLAVWSPFAAKFAAQVGVVSGNFWVEDVTLASALQFIPFLFEIRFTWPIKGSVLLVLLAALGLFAISRWGRRDLTRLMLGVAGLAYALLLLYSLLVQSILVDRLLIWVSLPFYVAVAAGLVAMRRRWLRVLLVVAIVALSLQGYVNYQRGFEREPWRNIAAHLAEHAGPDDVVVNLPNDNVIPLAYYLDAGGGSLKLVGLPVPYPSFDESRLSPVGVIFTPAVEAADLARLDEVTEGAAAVWYVARETRLFDPDRIVLHHLQKTRRLAWHWPVRQHIDVYRFE